MTEIELKALETDIKTEQKKQSDAVALLIKASDDQKIELIGKLEESDKKLEKMETEKKTLQTQVDQIELKMKDQTKLISERANPLAEIKTALTDPKVRAEIKNKVQKTFELKVSQIDLVTELSNGTTDLSAAVVIPFREAGVVKAPDRMLTLLDIIGRSNISSNRVSWVERTARTDGISTSALAAIVEGAIYKQSDFTWAQKFAPVEKIGTYVKCTNETLEDWDQLASQITNELIPMVERALELEVYSGTGTSPQMQGIIDVCSAFDLATITGIITPNLVDVIRACVAQIRSNNFFGQLTALVNPLDAAIMDMPKNADGIYLLPPMLGSDRRTVGGCRVVESALVDAGSILVGDFSKDTLFTKRGIEIKFFNQEASDAIYDLTTITASCRAVNRLALPDYDAFVYDTISDIVTAIS